MPEIVRDLLIHEDSAELTYHSSVVFPDVVPVVVDANDEFSIGRARIRHEDGRVWVDLHLDEEFPGIPRPFTCMLGVTTDETKLFHSEDGTNYLIYGGVTKVSVLSGPSPVIPPSPVPEWEPVG